MTLFLDPRRKVEAICSHLCKAGVIFYCLDPENFYLLKPPLSDSLMTEIRNFISNSNGRHGCPMFEIRNRFKAGKSKKSCVGGSFLAFYVFFSSK